MTTPMWYRVFLRILILAAVAGAASASSPAGHARAQTSQRDVDAQLHFTSAQAYFDRGEYEDAAREFRAAYALSHRPGLLFNIHLAEERLGHFAAAADMLAQYLAEQADVENRELLEDRLRNLRARAAEEEAARRAADEEAARRAAEAGPTTAAGSPIDGRHVPRAAIVAFGVAGAGAVSFAIAGGLALAEDRALASRCGLDEGRVCTDTEVARLERRTRTADVSMAVGLGAAATGLVLFFVLDDEQPPPVTAYVGREGSGLLVRGRF